MHIVVFSHLRWDFVYQRPQHLLARLADRFPVLYTEEPKRDEQGAWMESSSPCSNVEVLRPHTPVAALGFHDDQLSVLQPLVAQSFKDRGIEDYVVWFYTPMALPLLSALTPRTVIYDCMDELSMFKAAPRQLRQRESALMMRASVVFTGGPSLYEAKKDHHPNVICLPSAVDAAHYSRERALSDSAAVAAATALQLNIPEPRLGFFGVIDERLDLKLLSQLADADPKWQIVMVGPVAKIDPAILPKRDNIHWLGQQDYGILPQLVASWSLCLMPFALNESTRFISPTKTLEYMAAGKPVVSTRIRDVVGMFGAVVEIADDASDFVKCCQRVLAESKSVAAQRRWATAATVNSYSWDRAASAVQAEIEARTTWSSLSVSIEANDRNQRPVPERSSGRARAAT